MAPGVGARRATGERLVPGKKTIPGGERKGTPSILPPDCRERLLTTRDIAARLLMQPRTVALWARMGRLPAYRLGQCFRFSWDEVERALAATCRVGACQPGTPEDGANLPGGNQRSKI